MFLSVTRSFVRLAVIAILSCVLGSSALSAQVVDNLDFKALPRTINYATPLAPKDGAKAVIVYGKDAPWTKAAAEAVQKAVADWSGVKLDLADDRTVTSDETWLLNDAYRKTPLIVLGNAQDNRVMHALGTRYLLQSNRVWPGGDRYVVRSMFEPFVADVNYILLEASNQTGMDAAAAKFADLIRTFPAEDKATATIPPRLRVVDGVKDKWTPYPSGPSSWNPALPPEMARDLSRSVMALAAACKTTVPKAGWEVTRMSSCPNIFGYALGGDPWPRGADRPTPTLDDGTLRAIAAEYLLGCREDGGRAGIPTGDHYATVNFLALLRSVFQTGLLTAEELNEFESAIVLDAAHPDFYFFNHAGSGDDIVGGIWSGRHSTSSLLTVIQQTEYALSHCNLDERTRKEVRRRYDGAMKSAASYVRSFRGNEDDSCLGEDTVLELYVLLYEGFMGNVRNGMLRRSADMYIMTSDNIPARYYFANPHTPSSYAGLSGFSSGPGGVTCAWEGGSLLTAAAFYYDDPQYRWFVRNKELYLGSEAAWSYPMHGAGDLAGPAEEPTRYYGVHALPFDERIYGVLANPQAPGRMWEELRLPPESPDKAIDRASFRDGFDPNDAYLFLASSENISMRAPAQNNSIAKYTDLSDIWLYTNTYNGTTWARSAVNISNGRSFIPHAGCQLEAIANLGDVSMISSREPDCGGADWTRTIVHLRGHYFAVLDRMQSLRDDDYTFTCRWRSLQSGALANGAWTVAGPGGNVMRIQSAEDVMQTSEAWTCDGSAEPFVLQQYKQGRLAKGQEQTYQNLMYVSGPQRPDEFETRANGPRAMMVKGRTKDGDHLALIGMGGNIPMGDFQSDAAIYDLSGDQLRLAGVTSLTAMVGDSMREIFWARRPVNAVVDCRTGKAEIEVTGDNPVTAKTGQTWCTLRAGRQTVTLAQANVLPKLAELLKLVWTYCPAPSGKAPAKTSTDATVFEVKPAADPIQRPLVRLTGVTLTPQPNGTNDDGQTWNDKAKDLELLLTFPEPTEVGVIRLVGPSPNAFGRSQKGPFYQMGDFTFSLVLSDDNFQKDVRKIDAPKFTLDETVRLGAGHFVLNRYPTWRIEVGATARQVKVLPRSTAVEGRNLVLRGVDVYGEKRVDQVQTQALAADIDGDGSNELVVGTSQRELAAYNADGKLLWRHPCDGDILNLDAADLDENGKSEVLAYLTTEKLHRVNGDGTERPIGDVNTMYAAGLRVFGTSMGTNIFCLSAWGPDNPKKKEVLLWSIPAFKVLPSGKVQSLKEWDIQGSLRLVNFCPGEPEALALLNSSSFSILSARRDAKGDYIVLGSRGVTGSNSGNEANPPGNLRQFCKILAVEDHGRKWLVGAVACGLNCYPLASFTKGAKEEGWKYNTGGPCGAAVLAEDIDGDGVPEILYATQDGFVNVFKLADGAPVGRLCTGEPIIGMVMLTGKDGKPRIAVGTKFGVYLYGTDLKKIGGVALQVPAAAFAGPGGKQKDRVYVVDAAGNVNVLVLKP